MAEPKRHDPRNDPAPLSPQPVAGGIAARALGARGAAYLADLNPEQREAVETLDGPVLVLAGAGTGKTRVLTTRIAHILNLGRARPAEILAVTFTNKAAREMKDRVGQMVGQIVEGMPWLGTFHSIGVKILRRHAEMVGLKNNFTILDVDDQIRVIKMILEAEKLDDKRWPARVLAMLIDGWKNRGLTPEQVPSGEAASFANGKGKKLYMAYQERLKTLNAADFGDLLLENIRLFRQHADVLRNYQERFKFILVDEYQDTNVAQYLWLKLLAQTTSGAGTSPSSTALSSSSPGRAESASPGDPRLADVQEDVDGRHEAGHDGSENVALPATTRERHPKNICCVGDDDQSIYGWRGAEVDNILRFDHDFPGAKVIRLERNYRSTGHILAAASHLIAHNEGRLGKTLRTEDVLGEKVQVTGGWDSEEEARAIGEEIEQLQREARERGEDHPLDEIAILVRASFQMREFEDRFIQLGLPYRVIGGPRFYERMEIRDALAYLRVIAQPADDLAFERIVNTPRRGLGESALRTLRIIQRANKVSLFEATRRALETDKLKGRQRKSLGDLIQNFDRWRAMLDGMNHVEVVETILDESGYTDMLRADRSPEAEGRLENLKELTNALLEFETLPAFLEHVALLTDNAEKSGGDMVSVMTLHAAKGLEFDTVFLPGWEEGLFPNQRALDEKGVPGLEEERRLAYVGLTRARKRAYVSFAANRRVFNQWNAAIPSRFVRELPTDRLAESSDAGLYATYSVGHHGGLRDQASGFDYESLGVTGVGRARTRWRDETFDDRRAVEGDKPDLAIGQRVFHQKFGYGRVLAIDGNKLDIEFEKAGPKKVLDSFIEAA
jgi:DNA helicase-2/ATP-dependent DNA helicase PcrA